MSVCSRSNWNLKVLVFLRRGENWSTWQKTSRSKGENQRTANSTHIYGVDARIQQSPQSRFDPRRKLIRFIQLSVLHRSQVHLFKHQRSNNSVFILPKRCDAILNIQNITNQALSQLPGKSNIQGSSYLGQIFIGMI